MKREDFLARVRQSAAVGRTQHVHVRHDLPEKCGYVGAGDDPIATLADQIGTVGGYETVVERLDDLRHAVLDWLAARKPKSAFCWQHPLLDRIGLAELLAEVGCSVLSYEQLAPLPAEEQRRRILAADLGISSVWRAVAETGSLVVTSRPGQERLASLAPPVHLALVHAGQVVPDLFDLFAELSTSGTLPSNVTFITGPSKTGDIELQLTTGVHGPGEWHVMICRESLAIPG